MKHLLTSTAFILSALPAMADITPAEVVENIQETARIMGQTILIGETEIDGNDIILYEYLQTTPFKDGELTLVIGWLKFTDMGDGTVDISNEPDFEIEATFIPKYGEPETIRVDVVSPGVMHASGDSANIRYSMEPSNIEFHLDFTQISDGPDHGDLRLTLKDVVFDFLQTTLADDNTGMAGSFNVGTVELLGSFSSNDDPASVTVNARIDGVETTIDSQIGPVPERGYYGRGDTIGTSSYTIGPIELNAAGKDKTGSAVSFNGSIDSVSGDESIDADYYIATQIATNLRISATGPDVPVERMDFGMESITGAIKLPNGAQGVERDYGFNLDINGLTVNEATWALIDPDQTVPRDPANFALDLSGKAKAFVDLLGMMDGDEPPMIEGPWVEMISFDLNRFAIDIAGASLLGSGGLTFPGKGGIGARDFPEPVGKFTFNVQGAQQLIRTLGKLPMIPAEFTFGAMSIIGMFSAPTGEADSFESVVEFGEGGAITVNGIKMQ